ncbi:hypothetical protein [Actinacidiphila glaucinigra]|uniref:hypothetical protein n=1 Tax=Actinacidiphila glaucinigra TaxID=235986 RepID=UPI0037176B21
MADITDEDVLNVAAAIDGFHADAVIEEAICGSRLTPEHRRLVAMAEASGDPVKAQAAHLLVDAYETGLFKDGA